jgi:hypothetical protein
MSLARTTSKRVAGVGGSGVPHVCGMCGGGASPFSLKLSATCASTSSSSTSLVVTSSPHALTQKIASAPVAAPSSRMRRPASRSAQLARTQSASACAPGHTALAFKGWKGFSRRRICSPASVTQLSSASLQKPPPPSSSLLSGNRPPSEMGALMLLSSPWRAIAATQKPRRRLRTRRQRWRRTRLRWRRDRRVF